MRGGGGRKEVRDAVDRVERALGARRWAGRGGAARAGRQAEQRDHAVDVDHQQRPLAVRRRVRSRRGAHGLFSSHSRLAQVICLDRPRQVKHRSAAADGASTAAGRAVRPHERVPQTKRFDLPSAGTKPDSPTTARSRRTRTAMNLELGILLALACAFVANLGFFYKYRGANAVAKVERAPPAALSVRALFSSELVRAGHGRRDRELGAARGRAGAGADVGDPGGAGGRAWCSSR